MEEQIRLGEVEAGLLDHAEDAFSGIRGRRRRFCYEHTTFVVEQDEVRERSPDSQRQTTTSDPPFQVHVHRHATFRSLRACRTSLRSVSLCKEHGLIEGSHLSVDGFHAAANAALRSLRASLEPIAGEAGREPEGGPEPELPQLRLAEPRSGPTPKRKASNATAVSRTDADARLKGKPGQRPHLVYRGHVAVDPKARCVAACLGERAEGHEGDALAPILERVRSVLPELVSVGADQGFAAERVWEDAAERGIVAYIPPQKTMLPREGRAPRTKAQQLALAARTRGRERRTSTASGPTDGERSTPRA